MPFVQNSSIEYIFQKWKKNLDALILKIHEIMSAEKKKWIQGKIWDKHVR